MSKLNILGQAFKSMQPDVRILAPSMLGAKMEGSLSFLASLEINKL